MLFKQKIFIILTIILLGFSGSGIKCLKEREKKQVSAPIPSPALIPTSAHNLSNLSGTPSVAPSASPTKVLSQSEQLAVDFVKSFIVPYTNYKWGDFSNWDALNDKITQSYQKEFNDWIDKKKKELKNQPPRHMYFVGLLKNIEIIKFDGARAEVKAEVEQEEIHGAIVARTNMSGPTSVWVDELGKETPYDKIERKIYTKIFYLVLINENNKWKVDSVSSGN